MTTINNNDDNDDAGSNDDNHVDATMPINDNDWWNGQVLLTERSFSSFVENKFGGVLAEGAKPPIPPGFWWAGKATPDSPMNSRP